MPEKNQYWIETSVCNPEDFSAADFKPKRLCTDWERRETVRTECSANGTSPATVPGVQPAGNGGLTSGHGAETSGESAAASAPAAPAAAAVDAGAGDAPSAAASAPAAAAADAGAGDAEQPVQTTTGQNLSADSRFVRTGSTAAANGAPPTTVPAAAAAAGAEAAADSPRVSTQHQHQKGMHSSPAAGAGAGAGADGSQFAAASGAAAPLPARRLSGAAPGISRHHCL